MAQTMINFRLDENIKRDMESACKEMGLSMTAAFTVFATKVGKERRIPFELTAERTITFSRSVKEHERGGEMEDVPGTGPERTLAQMREKLIYLCGEVRRSLTSIHTAIPASIPGLTIEKIRLLCGDELKDKTAATLSGIKSVLSDRNMAVMAEKDYERLGDYTEALSQIREEVRNLETALVPIFKSWAGEPAVEFEPFESRLSAVSKQFDSLRDLMNTYLRSTVRKQGTARSLQGKIQRAAIDVSDPEVRVAIERLEALVLHRFDSLHSRTKNHLETHYLQTLALVLEELAKAECNGEETAEKVHLCIRVVNVMEQTIEEGRRMQDALSNKALEAEVVALERIAAMRGDVPDGLIP